MMFKIALVCLCLFAPSAAFSQSCADNDREVGKEIGKIFYMMRNLYLNNQLSHAFMDEIMTEMHLKYGEEYELAFQIASRHAPTECVIIRDMGVAWARSYEEKIINEINSGNR